MVASFRFADGSIGNLTYSTMGSKTSQGELVEAYQQGLGISSENFKRLTVNGVLSRSTKAWIADKGYDPQLADFIGAIREGRPPTVTVLDGIRATIGCLRAIESAKHGGSRAVDLSLFHAGQ